MSKRKTSKDLGALESVAQALKAVHRRPHLFKIHSKLGREISRLLGETLSVEPEEVKKYLPPLNDALTVYNGEKREDKKLKALVAGCREKIRGDRLLTAELDFTRAVADLGEGVPQVAVRRRLAASMLEGADVYGIYHKRLVTLHEMSKKMGPFWGGMMVPGYLLYALRWAAHRTAWSRS